MSSKKGIAEPELYIPSNSADTVFMSEMMALSHKFKEDEPWVDFEFDELMAAWPEPLPSVANAIGVTTLALERFLAGYHSYLSQEQLLALRKILCIRRNAFGGDYSDAEGPYILAPTTIRAARDSYNAATGGGDVEMCCEFVPKSQELLSHLLEIEAPHIIGFTRIASDISFIVVPRKKKKALPKAWKDAFFNIADEPVELDNEDYSTFLNTAMVALISPQGRSWILRLHSELYGEFLKMLERDQSVY